MNDKKDLMFMFPGTFNKGSECFQALAKSLKNHFDCRLFDYPDCNYKFKDKPPFPCRRNINFLLYYLLARFGLSLTILEETGKINENQKRADSLLCRTNLFVQIYQCGQEITNFIAKEQKDGQKIILLGHSKGALCAAWLAQWLWAVGHGDKVKAVIMIAPAAPGNIKNFSFSAFWALKSVLFSCLFGSLVKRSFTGTCRGVLNGLSLSQNEKKKIWENLYWEPRQVFLDLIFSPPEVELIELKCPKLIIGGAIDRLVPPKICKSIAKHYKADYIEIYMPHYMLDSILLISYMLAWCKDNNLL